MSLEEVLTIYNTLNEEGKSDEEIEGSLDEGITDYLKKFLMPGGDKDSDREGNDLNVDNIASKGGSGIMSQVREYVIRKMFGLVGFEGKLASALAAGFADLGINEIIGMFRGGSDCVKHGPAVADAVIEAVITFLSGSTEKNSMAYNFMRNTLGEYVRGSQIGEVIATEICNADIKGSLSSLTS